ncbi:MAG TPA: IS1595 family transposase [Rhizomicrobium sp.]|nr:IS1595 family transposase [Rhizomicrobium sp.]
MSILDATFFRKEEAAYNKLESVLWPNGTECPHCGVVDTGIKIAANPEKKVRFGLWKCADCKKQFTVTVGTVFESSHIPLHKWLQAAYLLNSSKKGISAKQIERTLQVTYKTAWFMMHRLREAMIPAGKLPPMGGEGRVIEADETYMGKRDGKPSKPDTFVTGFGWMSHPKIDTQRKIVALVERGGSARSFLVEKVDGNTIRKILLTNADRKSTVMTDEHPVYTRPAGMFEDHQTVNHGEYEYARGAASTNTVEGYFSIFKRGMKGIYQHCSEKHLHRYLAEFDFRYSNRERLGVNDVARTAKALIGAKGKRLQYRGPDSRRA